MVSSTLGYQQKFWEFVKNHFSKAYHENFHSLLPFSLTLGLHLIENVEERKKGSLIHSRMNFENFIFAHIAHISAI